MQCTKFHQNRTIFHWNMAILRFSKWRPSAMLGSKNLQFLSRSPCRPAVLLTHTKFCWNRTIGRFMAKKAIAELNFLIFKTNIQDGGRSHLEFLKIFGDVTVTGFNIWCSVPNFIKIGQFFTEIWRFYDFQNDGRPPCWIVKICIFRHVALVDLTFCFLVQNFAEIGQSVDDLWPK